MAGQPCPVRGLLAFLDSLLRRAALIVETHHQPARQRHVRHDEADAREQLARVILDLGDDTSRL